MAGNYTICVGTIGSGLWLSPDGGDSWQRVREGLCEREPGVRADGAPAGAAHRLRRRR